MNRFLQYHWPGNIRQLENSIKQFLVLPDHHSLFAELITTDQPIQADQAASGSGSQSYSLLDVGANAADRAERELVERTLAQTNGNRREAARRMNVSYKGLLNKIKRWTTSMSTADAEANAAKGEAA
jgi:DNA-binding NtrC family response regulator